MKIVLDGLNDGKRTSWILPGNVGTYDIDFMEIRNLELSN
jgi:hypothetical protein